MIITTYTPPVADTGELLVHLVKAISERVAVRFILGSEVVRYLFGKPAARDLKQTVGAGMWQGWRNA